MSRSHPRLAGPAAIALLLASASPARAHLAFEGAGDIGNGMLHPVTTPFHVLIIVGLGLLIGTRAPLELKKPALILALSSAAALLATAGGAITAVHPSLLALLALGLGGLVAIGIRRPFLVTGTACAAAGIAIGLDSAVESGTAPAVLKTLVGTWLALNATIGYLAICASHGAERRWAMTGIRIIGSWIAAISLLVLAFALRK